MSSDKVLHEKRGDGERLGKNLSASFGRRSEKGRGGGSVGADG